jgi:hypothetical protein
MQRTARFISPSGAQHAFVRRRAPLRVCAQRAAAQHSFLFSQRNAPPRSAGLGAAWRGTAQVFLSQRRARRRAAGRGDALPGKAQHSSFRSPQ